MSLPPVVVAYPGAAFPVGVARWRQHGSSRLTLVAKLTFALDRAELMPEQVPLDGHDDDDGFEPGDFAPRKAGADVILLGSARGASGAQRHAGSLAIPSARCRAAPERVFRRELSFGTGDLAPLVPMMPGRVFEADGTTPAGPLGKVAQATGLPLRGDAHDDDFDFAVYQNAILAQQVVALLPEATIELGGALAAGTDRKIALPRAPWLYLDRGFGDGELAELVCDTLTLDLDAGTLVAVWRCDRALDEADLADIDRVIARWAPSADDLDLDDVRRSVPRATFVLAEELGRVADPADAEILRVAVFDAMEVSADPSLDVVEYAGISAALAEGRPPREQVLARHGLTEEAWAIEERAQGEAFAQGISVGDIERSVVFGEAFVTAQEALADPHEAGWTVEEHGLLTAQLESTRDVAATLAEHKLVLGSFMRIDRRIGKLIETDADARRRFEIALEEGRVAHPDKDDEDEDEVDEDDESQDGESEGAQ